MFLFGIIFLIVSIILGGCLYFFSEKWKEQTVFNIQIIFKGFVCITVIIFSISFLNFFISDSSEEFKKTLEQKPKITIYTLKVQGNKYESISKFEVKKEKDIYKARYEIKKGQFKKIEFTADYIITEREVFKEEGK